jgi:hypothetical protein
MILEEGERCDVLQVVVTILLSKRLLILPSYLGNPKMVVEEMEQLFSNMLEVTV